jgi:hypothetical protein
MAIIEARVVVACSRVAGLLLRATRRPGRRTVVRAGAVGRASKGQHLLSEKWSRKLSHDV